MKESDPPKTPRARKASPATSAKPAGGVGAGTGASTGSGTGSSKVAAPKKTERTFERSRGGEARQIADLMPAIGRTAFRRFGFVQSSVVTRWPEIVGAAHARHCVPESIRFAPGEKSDGIMQLVVTPAHAPLIQHVIP